MKFTNYKELLKNIRSLNFKNAPAALAKIAELEKDERYQFDYAFRTVLNMEKVAALRVLGRYDECRAMLETTIEEARISGDQYLLLETYARIGSAFSYVSQADQAISIYMQVIQIEKNLGEITNKTAVAYNNIAAIYEKYKKFDKSEEYYQLARENIKDDPDNPDYSNTIKLLLTANLAHSKFGNKDYDEGYKLLQSVEFLQHSDVATISIATYKKAMMRYYGYTDNFDKCYKEFKDLIDMLREQKNYPKAVDVVRSFYELCVDNDVCTAIPIKHIKDILKDVQDYSSYENLRSLYIYLINFYIDSNNYQAIIENYKKLEKLAKENSEKIKEQQLNTINLRIDLDNKNEYNKIIETKNKELERLNDEYLKQSRQLNETYNRLCLITWIGQKLVSTSTYSDLAKEMYNELKKIVSYDIFSLVMKDEKKNILVSDILYELNEIENNFIINIDDESSIVARCYREGEIIVSNNLTADRDVLGGKFISSSEKKIANSAIYFPLMKEEQCLAVLTLQSYKNDAYTEDDINFIKFLAPFLTIAIINTSNVNKLKELSNKDELTQMYNRRYFYNQYEDMIFKARNKKLLVHCFMLDIDYFKNYNDTFGHIKGDQTLVKVAEIINDTFSSHNTICARYGGEEFIALAIGIDGLRAYQIADDLRQKICDLQITHKYSKKEFVTISVGVASFNFNLQSNNENLIQLADDCLYTAKNSGRDKVVAAVLI